MRLFYGLFFLLLAQARSETDSLLIQNQEFQGLRTTSLSVVKRELQNHIGEFFTEEKWQAERQKLQDLDIFADIQIQKKIEAPDSAGAGSRHVSLVYTFRELPPYIPFIAISKTEQDGFSAGPALASLNFLGQGIRAEFISRFGGTTEFQASLSSQRFFDLPLQYDFAILRIDSYNNFGNFHEDSWRTKLDLIHRLGGPFNLIYAGEIFHLNTQSPISASPSTTSDPVLLNPKGDWVPRLGAGFLWDSRDKHHDPRHGLYQELRLTQNGGFIGGPADYQEWLSDTRIYLPWLSRNTLQLAGLYQYRTGIADQTFGRYDLFHAGGVNTLRGFPHDSFQGKSEYILTIENRHDLIKKQTVKVWKWSAYYGLQGILGVEMAALWNHDALLESSAHPSYYGGIDILLAGVDRIRIQTGSNFSKILFQTDVGILDKADIQRFRSR